MGIWIKLLINLSLMTDLPQQQLIYNSLQEYKKKMFWEQCKIAYSNSSKNNNDEENNLYDNTLMDVIEDEY